MRRFGSWGPGAWSWFADPRAVFVAGQCREIFVGWIDRRGAVTVGAYAPGYGVVGKHVVGWLFHDDHGSPAIFVEPDNRLTVFFSAHNGGAMSYRSTLRPEDISAWGPHQQVPSRLSGGLGFTYPNPVLLPAERNRLYLFWRGADWTADYATRTPDGRWSGARELIRVPGERPYLKVATDGQRRIAIAFTDGHPRDTLTSIYYIAYRTGSLWRASGRWTGRIGRGPISPSRGDVVYDARRTGVPAWVWDVAFDRQAHPIIVYATFPSVARHQYWYARWTGGRWISHFLTNGGGTISPGGIEYEYSGGLALDHSHPSTVYLSRQVPRGWRIERWCTRNGGYRWRHKVVVPAEGHENVRPVVPRGWDRGPMSLLWLHGHYGSYNQYATSVTYLR